MQNDMTRQDVSTHGLDTTIGGRPDEAQAHERAVDVILADAFLSLGQAIGLRASLDFDAAVWVHTHFRVKFLAAMAHHGNRWLEDRAVVTAVVGLLGERAVRYADGAASIGLDAVRQAAADVEKYCRAHAQRASRARGSDADTARIAGYWCTWDPKE
jgi:hypothetical protein